MSATVQFLQENCRELLFVLFMAIWWMCIGFFSVKGDIKSLDKKRIAKGMVALTDDEKQLIKQTFYSSILGNFIHVIIAGIVTIIVVTII